MHAHCVLTKKGMGRLTAPAQGSKVVTNISQYVSVSSLATVEPPWSSGSGAESGRGWALQANGGGVLGRLDARQRTGPLVAHLEDRAIDDIDHGHYQRKLPAVALRPRIR